MFKWMLHRQLRAFERQHGYDATYMHELLDTDAGAFWRFFRATSLGKYRKDVPLEVYFAAQLTASVAADCGPCTQLGVGFALEAGVPAATIAAVLRDDEAAMSPEVALGVRFARAVLVRDALADVQRAEIVRRWGPRAVLALAFGIMATQLYPTLKYALGHGKACSRVRVGAEMVVPHGRLAAEAR